MNNTLLTINVSFIDKDEISWANTVFLINQNITRYLMIIVWFVGNIGSILNCLTFAQSTLRESPCAMYFIASNISQFLMYNFSLLTRISVTGFGIKTLYREIWYCKFRHYFFYVFLATTRYYTILASVDRYLASCRKALHRRWSSPTVALRLIIANVTFWCFIYIHVIVFYQTYPNNCLPQKGLYTMIFSIYILFDNGILPLSLMILFGVLTLKNLRQIKHRVRPAVTSIITNQPNEMKKKLKKDKQFLKMLLSQIGLYIVFNIFNPCFLLYQAISVHDQKSLVRLEVEALLNNISYFLIYIGFSLTFLINLFSSSLFQNEFKRFVQRKICHRRILRPLVNRPV